MMRIDISCIITNVFGHSPILDGGNQPPVGLDRYGDPFFAGDACATVTIIGR